MFVMRYIGYILLTAFGFGIALFFLLGRVRETATIVPLDVTPSPTTPQFTTFEISSSAFGDNQRIPSQYTCDGRNTHPPLQISRVPEGTETLALIADDIDAPGGNWVHWLVWDISPDIQEIGEGNLPSAWKQGTNSFEKAGYGGPCPPKGASDHRYVFTLYALDTTLTLPETATRTELESAIAAHIIAKGQIIGLYSR